MNAIIALCHFCDHHGPSTIFCTQAFKYTESAATSGKKVITSRGHVEVELEAKDVVDVLPFSKPSFVTTSPSSPSPKSNTGSSVGGTKASCKACCAFNKGFHHYISYEKEVVGTGTDAGTADSRICYISQATPSDPEVFAVVRKACLRTLHCEIFEDPIYFDDDSNGSVIGYEFNIKDCEGRGFQRSYSLMIIMKDRIYLQHLWSFLSKQMSVIALNIKAEAERKFEKDMRDKGLSLFPSLNPVSSTPSTTTTTAPPATTTSASSTSTSSTTASATTTAVGEAEFFSAQNISQRDTIQYAKRGSSQTQQQQQQHNQQQQQRGLIELCDDEQIFAKLHMWFTWLLRVSTSRLSELLVQAAPPEDCLVALERERHLTEFNLLGLSYHYDHMDGLSTSEEESASMSSRAAIAAAVSGSSNGAVTYDKELSQLIIENLRQLIKLIGFEKFHKLAYHTVVGNQVIVRSKYENLVVSIIKCLEELIPVGCCKSVYYSNEYIKSYRCKLLGLCDSVSPFESFSTTAPVTSMADLDLNEYVFVDLVDDLLMEDMMPQPKEMTHAETANSMTSHNMMDDGDDDEDTNSTTMMTTLLDSVIESNKLTIILRTNTPEISHVPTILKRIESFLMNENLDDNSVSSLIQLTKEQWLNKTKVFYKFIHSPIEKTSESVDKLFKMLNLEPTDELALKFWQAGLSNECKVQIRKS